jgi:hypothetical protein
MPRRSAASSQLAIIPGTPQRLRAPPELSATERNPKHPRSSVGAAINAVPRFGICRIWIKMGFRYEEGLFCHPGFPFLALALPFG